MTDAINLALQQIAAAVYRDWLAHVRERPEWRNDLTLKADFFYFDRAHRESVNG